MWRMTFTIFLLIACNGPDEPDLREIPDACADSGACAPEGSACADSRTCCSGATCSRFGRDCRPARDLPLGETCASDAQCASKLCDPARGACSAPCSSGLGCDSETVCVRDASLGWTCLPVCASDAGCEVYAPPVGRRLRCLFGAMYNGLAAGVCSP